MQLNMKIVLFLFLITVMLSSCSNYDKGTIIGKYDIYEATMYKEPIKTSGKLQIEYIDNQLDVKYISEYKCACSYLNTDSIFHFHCILKQNKNYYDIAPVENSLGTSYEGKVQYDNDIITIYDLKGDYIKAKKE